jgi:phosphonate transport system substrate-binding protein
MTLSADYTYSCTANRFVFILTSRLNRMQNDMPRVGRAPVNNSTVVTPVPGASRRAILTGLTSAALAAVTGAARATSDPQVLTFGVFPYVPALKIGDLFAPMAANFELATGRPVQLRTKDTFEKFGEELAAGSYDLVLGHPFLYVDAHAKQGYQPLARIDQELRAVILSRSHGKLAGLAELRGQTLAMPAKQTAAAYLVWLEMMDQGLRPEIDIHMRYYNNKISCLHAVAAGDAVGCVVPSFVIGQLAEIDQLQLRPIWQGAPISGLVLAAHPRLSEDLRQRLRGRILGWSATGEGRRLLGALKWSGALPASDGDYDSIRALARRIHAYVGG